MPNNDREEIRPARKKAEPGLRIPMFFKFLVGCLTLAALLIAGGILIVRSETKMASRGKYLEKHFDRYTESLDDVGRTLSAVADMAANDATLRASMSGATTRGATAPADGDAVDAPAEPALSSGAIAEGIFKVLSGKNSVQPDLMVVFTSAGELVWASPGSVIDSDDLKELRVTAWVREGSAFFNKMLVEDNQVFQSAGVPIRSSDSDEVIGGLILGVRIERYLERFKEQSDKREVMQHRISIVRDNQVVASVIEPELWPELGTQTDKDQWQSRRVGNDVRDVIAMSTGDYDFNVRDVEGFAGLESGKVAKMFLMRSRSNLKGRGAKVPWKEIVVGVVLSVLIASLLALWITSPIKKFVLQSQDILEGETDLTQRIQLRSHDETQDLAENINMVFARLYSLASEVQGAAFQVGASSAEISAASKQMLGGLKDQTLKIEGSASAITELSASIQQVAANAAEATNVAEKSNIAVTSAVTAMQEIRGSVETAADKMQELGDSSKRIGNIVEVIRQISEQTSLLALNASIEAAHAGEQGRGFAVVADEVSSLARRVGQSAKDIEALIQTIKEQTSAAMHSMEIGTREVEGGTGLVTNTLTDLQQLISVVKDTAAAVQEQAVVSDEIARNMDAVQKIAMDVLSGSEESVVQAEQLHELAFALEQSVGGFNLDGSGARTKPVRGQPAGRQLKD